MQIVIDIPEDRYKDIQRIAEVQLDRNHFQTAEQIIANGVALPKGHGRLIDADAYRNEMLNSREFNFFKILDVQQTIIEADKAESEGN